MEKMFICSHKVSQEISDNKGISLVAVTIVMLLVAAFALVIASLMSTGNISAITDMQAQQAFYIAQAGMSWYLEQLEGDNNWKTPPAVKTNQAFGAGLFSITYANESKDDIDVTSTATVNAWDGNTVKRVLICHITRPKKGDMITSLWHESL